MLTEEIFYDETKIALMPMEFCYPGKGKSGDLPPRPERTPQWHQKLLDHMPHIKSVILIGMYSQKYYLKEKAKRTLTETVAAYKTYLPIYLPLPLPSSRNRFWMNKNSLFKEEVLPELKSEILKRL